MHQILRLKKHMLIGKSVGLLDSSFSCIMRRHKFHKYFSTNVIIDSELHINKNIPKFINIRKEKPKAIYDNIKKTYINPPQSPTITINTYIYISNKTTETSFYYSIIKNTINSINTFFKKYHSYHYANYNFYFNHTFIYNPNDLKYHKTINNKIFQRTKINSKLIEKLQYFQNDFKLYSTKNSTVEIQALYTQFINEITPLIQDTTSNLSLLPVPNKDSLPFYDSLITDACNEIISCVVKPSKITINPNPSIIKLTTNTPTILFKRKFILEMDKLYNLNLLINITEKQLEQLLAQNAK